MVKKMKKRVISAIVALIIIIPLVLIGGYAYYFGVGILALNVHQRFICCLSVYIHFPTFNK